MFVHVIVSQIAVADNGNWACGEVPGGATLLAVRTESTARFFKADSEVHTGVRGRYNAPGHLLRI